MCGPRVVNVSLIVTLLSYNTAINMAAPSRNVGGIVYLVRHPVTPITKVTQPISETP